MLYPINVYLLDVFKKEITLQKIHEAQIDHLANYLRPQKSHDLVIEGLRDLGHALVFIGRRLDRIEPHS
jgi:hypothetical protein